VITTLWSVKGGSGVSVTAALVAQACVARHGGALLVDLAGDQPAVLGLAEPASPGVLDWLATPDSTPEALDRLRVRAGDGLELVPTGTGPGPEGRAEDLAAVLRTVDRPVVVDGGLGGAPVPALAAAGRSFLVVRPCYLALRRAVRSGVRADGVVVLAEPGRALDRRDVASVLGLPVVGALEVDPVVARAVDAGLLLGRSPRSATRAVRRLT
jgi:hypothetical protein